MSYAPLNLCTYLKAFSGTLAGLGGSGKYLTDPKEGDFQVYAQMAAAFAQQFDLTWGSVAPTGFEEDAIAENCEAVWETHSPLESSQAFTPSNYTALVNGVVALVRAGNAEVIDQGIDPNGCLKQGGSGGILSVADGTALGGLSTNNLEVGALAYVQSRSTYWVYQPDDVGPANGNHIPAQGGGFWVYHSAGNASAAAAVAHWYFNGTGGSYDNTGTESGSVLPDFEEFLRRVGNSSWTPTLSTVFEWTGDDGLADSDSAPYCVSPIMPQGAGNGVLINFIGDLVEVASGTLGAVSAVNATAGTALSADLGEAAIGSQGLLLYNATRNAYCHVDSLASTVASLTQPYAPSVVGAPAWWEGGAFNLPAQVNTFTTGDSFILYRQPKVKFGSLTPTTVGAWVPTTDGMLCMLGNLMVPDLTGGNLESFVVNPTVRLTQCRVDPLLQYSTNNSNGVGEQIFNCWLPGSIAGNFTSIIGGAINTLSTYIVSLNSSSLEGGVIVHCAAGCILGSSPQADRAFNTLSAVFFYGTVEIYGPTTITATHYPGAYVTGTYTIGDRIPQTSTLYYDGTAGEAFLGAPTLLANGHSAATAYDVSSGLLHPARALSVEQLDTSIAGGGFAGNALNANLVACYSATANL